MRLRTMCILGMATATGSAFAAPLVYVSTAFANNGAARTNWLAGAGITSPTVTIPFDDLADGDISGLANILPDLVLTAVGSTARITSLPSSLGGSNPVGTKALALREGRDIVLDFAAPIDHFAFLHMDTNTVTATVRYTDQSTTVHSANGGGASGNTAVFFGLARNDMPQISSVTLRATGGDGEWGIDNLEYGVVPEPASLATLAIGASLLSRRTRKRTAGKGVRG